MLVNRIKNKLSYNVLVTLLAFLLSVMLCVFELYSFNTRVQSRIIGLNEAWQLNISDPSEINQYPQNVINAYTDINDFLGFKSNDNIKAWFIRYLNSVNNLDTAFSWTNFPIGNAFNTPSTHWNIRKDIQYDDKVFYPKGELLGNIHLEDMNKDSKKVFAEFVNYIQYRLPGLDDPRHINAQADLEFNRYNKLVLNSIFGDGLKKFTLLDTNIRVYRFFIASNVQIKKGRLIRNKPAGKDSAMNEMMVYPGYAHETFNKIDILGRPWFKAVFNNNDFPLGFNKPDNTFNAKFGLTGLYNDVQTKSATVLDRTFTCKFNFPEGSDNEYVACLDLFLQNNYTTIYPFKIKMDDNLGHASLVSWLPFLNVSEGVGSIMDAILLSMVLYVVFRVEIVKNSLIKFFENLVRQHNDRFFIKFKLNRRDRVPLTENNINTAVELSYSRTDIRNFEAKRGFDVDAGWDFKLFSIKFNRGKQKTNTRNVTTNVKLPPLEVKLGVDNKNYYRCIDLWSVTMPGEANEIGTFVVKWLNTIYASDDIAIETLGRLNEMEKSNDEDDRRMVADLKRKFESMLIQSDEDTFRISINTKKAPDIIILPPLLREKRVRMDTLLEHFLKTGQRKRLLERKLFFSYKSKITLDDDYQLFLTLYQNVNIYAVCGVGFLENLWLNARLENFLIKTGDKERIFIESAAGEFHAFYRKIENDGDDSLAHLLKSISNKFFIWIYETIELKEGEISQIVYKNYDFALARDYDGLTQYVLFHTPNSTEREIGWLSWRQVDIDFYNAVYQMIRTRAMVNKKSVEEYLKMHEPANKI